MEFVNKLFNDKIRGIAATIIQAVINKTIDVQYVFSEQFVSDWENHSDTCKDIYHNLLEDWSYSLDYINQVPSAEREQVFGAYTHNGINLDGSDIAAACIANVFNESYVDADTALNPPLGYELVPHILEHPESFFIGNEYKLHSTIQKKSYTFCSLSYLGIPDPQNSLIHIVPHNGAFNLLALYPEDAIDLNSDYYCYGFAAALINAALTDAIHRNAYKYDFSDKQEIEELIKKGTLWMEEPCVIENLPILLCDPAKKIMQAYMPKAITAFSKYLYYTDHNFDDEDPMYVMRKMCEIECKKGGMPIDSELWKLFTPQQQQIFLDYYNYFINYLRNECGIEQEVQEQPTTTNNIVLDFAKQRGPKVQYLFADVNRNEDVERTRHEAERVKRYIADHHMGNMHLDSTNTNQLNLLVACFYYEWRERGWVSAQPQGAAIHRFLTEQCSLPCDVTPRAYARTIADLIKGNHKDYNISDNLRSYFK